MMLRPLSWLLSHKAGELPLAPFQFPRYAKGLCIVFSTVQKEFKDIIWISANLLRTQAARRGLNLQRPALVRPTCMESVGVSPSRDVTQCDQCFFLEAKNFY